MDSSAFVGGSGALFSHLFIFGAGAAPPPKAEQVLIECEWPPMRLLALCLISAALLSVSCSAHKQPSKVEANLANFAKRVVIPLEAKDRKNPLAPDASTLADGMALYQQSCSMCHGGDGRSETALGRGMYPPSMDLTSPHVRKWEDSELFWIIQNGVRFTGMPAWSELLDEPRIWKVVLAVRELQRAKPKPESAVAARSPQELVKEGKLLFRQENCIGCHMLNGEGGAVGPDLSDQGNKGRTDDWMIGHFQNPSAYTPGSMMPATTNLNRQQLQALTAFLQQQKQPPATKKR